MTFPRSSQLLLLSLKLFAEPEQRTRPLPSTLAILNFMIDVELDHQELVLERFCTRKNLVDPFEAQRISGLRTTFLSEEKSDPDLEIH